MAALELSGHSRATSLHGRLAGRLSRGFPRRSHPWRAAWLLHRGPGKPQQAQLVLVAHVQDNVQLPRRTNWSAGESRVPVEEVGGAGTQLPLGSCGVRPGVADQLGVPLPHPPNRLHDDVERPQRRLEAGRCSAGHQAEAERPVSSEPSFPLLSWLLTELTLTLPILFWPSTIKADLELM